ncbi:MAG: glycosyltransferase family 2 protein [bacterium]|nr:glycosyltransferase family 2 protein [bacterium]
MQIKSLSIFFPCYNDKGVVKKLIDDSLATVKELGITDYEIIYIDDGSTDGSRELLTSLDGVVQNLKVILHEKNRGYGGVLKTGFANATKEWVFYTDGDAQYDVRELALLVNALEEGVDWVSGYKIKRHDKPYRIIIGKMYQWFNKLLFLLEVRDVECNFRLMKKSKIDELKLKCNNGTACLELAKKLQNAGAVLREVPVHHYNRIYGESHAFTVRRIADMIVTLIILWWPLVVLRKTN